MSGILDSRSRPLRDLRISVTDRCNFRCTYCMPKEIFGRDYAFLPRAELLTFEEITRLTRAFASEGVAKIRLTGGEPLLRRDLERLVAMLASVDGICDIALTTNGSALAAKAQTLKPCKTPASTNHEHPEPSSTRRLRVLLRPCQSEEQQSCAGGRLRHDEKPHRGAGCCSSLIFAKAPDSVAPPGMPTVSIRAVSGRDVVVLFGGPSP